jgi:hypothetical protein
MTVALLNVLFLPTAQLAFSALACTDTRDSPRHLNQLPWIACDAAWRSAILPPAALTALLCLVPMAPFALLARHQRTPSDFGESLETMLKSMTEVR